MFWEGILANSCITDRYLFIKHGDTKMSFFNTANHMQKSCESALPALCLTDTGNRNMGHLLERLLKGLLPDRSDCCPFDGFEGLVGDWNLTSYERL